MTWRRRAARSASSAGRLGSNGTTAVIRCSRIAAPCARSRSIVSAESRSRSQVCAVPARHPADLRAAHRQPVVVELLAEPDRVRAVLVEGQVDHCRPAGAAAAAPGAARRCLAAALEHHVRARGRRGRAAIGSSARRPASSASRVEGLQPQASATARRCGVGSSTTTEAAPCRRASSAVSRATTPAPTTATRRPRTPSPSERTSGPYRSAAACSSPLAQIGPMCAT